MGSVGRTSEPPTACCGSQLYFTPQVENCRPCSWSVDYETALGGSGVVGGGSWILLPPLLPADWPRLLLLWLLQAQLVQGHGVLPQLRPWCQLGNAGHTWREQKDQDMVVRTWGPEHWRLAGRF